MRRVLYSISLTLVFFAFCRADDGRVPRAAGSDYPVHQETKTATIAAVRVTAEQLNKTFPADLARKYIVVEVAIYPKEGPALAVASMDFVLKLGSDTERRPETAEEVSWMWHPQTTAGPDLKSNTHVTTETGVILANGTDPTTGRRVNGVGTYESVGVSNAPTQTSSPAPSSNRVDADRMEALLKKWALQDGKVNSPVAGYLYFPLPAKKIKGALELQYEHDGSTANLALPASAK